MEQCQRCCQLPAVGAAAGVQVCAYCQDLLAAPPVPQLEEAYPGVSSQCPHCQTPFYNSWVCSCCYFVDLGQFSEAQEPLIQSTPGPQFSPKASPYQICSACKFEYNMTPTCCKCGFNSQTVPTPANSGWTCSVCKYEFNLQPACEYCGSSRFGLETCSQQPLVPAALSTQEQCPSYSEAQTASAVPDQQPQFCSSPPQENFVDPSSCWPCAVCNYQFNKVGTLSCSNCSSSAQEWQCQYCGKVASQCSCYAAANPADQFSRNATETSSTGACETPVTRLAHSSPGPEPQLSRSPSLQRSTSESTPKEPETPSELWTCNSCKRKNDPIQVRCFCGKYRHYRYYFNQEKVRLNSTEDKWICECKEEIPLQQAVCTQCQRKNKAVKKFISGKKSECRLF